MSTPQIIQTLVGGGLGRRQEIADAWEKAWAVAPARNWLAKKVFHADIGSRFAGGDDAYAWAGQVGLLAASAAAGPVWAALEGHRQGDGRGLNWFRLAIRMSLAGQMFSYGAAKAVPLQFQLPLAKLVEPFGHFSPMNVLWSQSAYSEVYQRLLGCAEIAAGLLLVAPRTKTLGALVSAAEMGQVLLLNMTFDVPVKIHSAHLLLLALVLLAPESRRLAAFFLADRRVTPPSPGAELFRSTRWSRIAEVAEVGVGLFLLGAQLRNDWSIWKSVGGGREKPELYGIWEVDRFVEDGQDMPPLTTEDRRWRRLIVESPDVVTVQHMDDSFRSYMVTAASGVRSLTLIDPMDPTEAATLDVKLLTGREMTLDGVFGGHHLHLQLSQLDLTSLPLMARRFRWIQDNAYWH